MLLAFEVAERQRAETGTQNRLTFVIVGGGPTGVELAGSLVEIGRKAMGLDYPHLHLEDLSIVLVEAGPRVLPGFDPKLSAQAMTTLERMGVTLKLNNPVTAIHSDGVMVGNEWVPSANIIWAADNKASPLLNTLAVPQDPCGRVKVQPDLTIPDDPWIFVIGDAAHCLDRDRNPLPGIAPVAIKEGQYVATVINEDLRPEQRLPFAYTDRGILATIGRGQAVAHIGPFRASGFWAWTFWCMVHIFFLIGLRNRIRVMSKWTWYYLTFKPGARLLSEQPGAQSGSGSTDHAPEASVETHHPHRRAA
jgi:NADH dehydrogenase